MADAASEYHRGDMNISEQERSFALFNGLTKWGSLAVATLILMLTVWFCTSAGFAAGAISGIVLFVAGVAVLRDKPQAAH
ncbi:aa3-type cytochrome c oxidase subunit IV [Caulobacter sp. KR2-114]|uniref:aa3-type cytochrome c oxidase subunit IV n=1 Tax=Caulobacter sp. KR2-114 TaxID=3400912 RepID=UPI003C10DA43